jgi:membrane protein implicated in regulation of membrane protease activity
VGAAVSEDTARSPVRFEPLRPASRAAVIVGIVLGPLLWLVVIAIAAAVFQYSWAIAVGLTVAFASFVVALVALTLLREGRVRQEERYVGRR